MTAYYESYDYYKKMLELQEKLRKSEEERIRLEERFKILAQESRNRHDACINRLRLRYIEFLEEQRVRDERNHKLLEALDKIDNSLEFVTAKTDKLNDLRKQYEANLRRFYDTPSLSNDSKDLRYPEKDSFSWKNVMKEEEVPFQERTALKMKICQLYDQGNQLASIPKSKSSQRVNYDHQKHSEIPSEMLKQDTNDSQRTLRMYPSAMQSVSGQILGPKLSMDFINRKQPCCPKATSFKELENNYKFLDVDRFPSMTQRNLIHPRQYSLQDNKTLSNIAKEPNRSIDSINAIDTNTLGSLEWKQISTTFLDKSLNLPWKPVTSFTSYSIRKPVCERTHCQLNSSEVDDELRRHRNVAGKSSSNSFVRNLQPLVQEKKDSTAVMANNELDRYINKLRRIHCDLQALEESDVEQTVYNNDPKTLSSQSCTEISPEQENKETGKIMVPSAHPATKSVNFDLRDNPRNECEGRERDDTMNMEAVKSEDSQGKLDNVIVPLELKLDSDHKPEKLQPTKLSNDFQTRIEEVDFTGNTEKDSTKDTHNENVDKLNQDSSELAELSSETSKLKTQNSKRDLKEDTDYLLQSIAPNEEKSDINEESVKEQEIIENIDRKIGNLRLDEHENEERVYDFELYDTSEDINAVSDTICHRKQSEKVDHEDNEQIKYKDPNEDKRHLENYETDYTGVNEEYSFDKNASYDVNPEENHDSNVWHESNPKEKYTPKDFSESNDNQQYSSKISSEIDENEQSPSKVFLESNDEEQSLPKVSLESKHDEQSPPKVSFESKDKKRSPSKVFLESKNEEQSPPKVSVESKDEEQYLSKVSFESKDEEQSAPKVSSETNENESDKKSETNEIKEDENSHEMAHNEPNENQEFQELIGEEYTEESVEECVENIREQFDSNTRFQEDSNKLYLHTEEEQCDLKERNNPSSKQPIPQTVYDSNRSESKHDDETRSNEGKELWSESKHGGTDEKKNVEKKEPTKKKDIITSLLDSDTDSTIERNVSNTESDFDFN